MNQSESNPVAINAFMELINLLKSEDISADLANKIGVICVKSGFITLGSEFFVKTLQTDANADKAHNNLGTISYQSGDYLSAEQSFYKAIEVNPANWDARRNLAGIYRHVPQLVERVADHFVHCPCCNGNFPGFIAGGPNMRPNAYCPRCGSLERHRLMWLYLKERTDFFTRQLKVLHVAPEKIYQDAFQAMQNLDYVSADLSSPLAMIKMDITDIPFEEDAFDVIICSHVLEHVPDDSKAMRELLRVLKPDGWAILQVPIDKNRAETFEDPTITDPAERQRLFGQDDHVRWYGLDYQERLRESGFIVSIEKFASEMTPDNICRIGIVPTEDIYRCYKHTININSLSNHQFRRTS